MGNNGYPLSPPDGYPLQPPETDPSDLPDPKSLNTDVYDDSVLGDSRIPVDGSIFDGVSAQYQDQQSLGNVVSPNPDPTPTPDPETIVFPGDPSPTPSSALDGSYSSVAIGNDDIGGQESDGPPGDAGN